MLSVLAAVEMNDQELGHFITGKLDETARAFMRTSEHIASRALTVGAFCEPEKYRDWAKRVKSLAPMIVVAGGALKIFLVDDAGGKLLMFEHPAPAVPAVPSATPEFPIMAAN